MKQKITRLLILIFILLITSACSSFAAQKDGFPLEQALTEIPLEGPITKKKAELSGLAWMGDTLILLPQYPEKLGTPGILFTIPKTSILDFLDGKSTDPITPGVIHIFMSGIEETIANFEGFEAIIVKSDLVYLTIESGKNDRMMGYIVSGKISSDGTEIRLDASEIVSIPPAVQLDNRTDEALFYYQDRLYTFFEANGEKINPSPAAHVFDLQLNDLGTVAFPHLEYRVTDAAIGADGGIWVINQASAKDADILPAPDPATGTPILETTTNNSDQSERLVKLEFDNNRFVLSKYPPILIASGAEHRNWEGLAVLDDRGFLLVTDKSPDTILGFVQTP